MTITVAALRERLGAIPRVRLGQYPTPLTPWPRLQQHLGRPGRIFAKREDLSGLALGGNKTRQLEFILGDARAQNADTIVHGGAVQSNYSRMLAAAAAQLGLRCHLVLSRHYQQRDDQGNCLLMRLFGATIHWYDGPLGEAYEARKLDLCDALRRGGARPYLITYPQSEILGTIAFIDAAAELFEQCAAHELAPRWLVMPAVGSTQSGLLLGSRWLGSTAKVLGFSPLREEFPVVKTLCDSIAAAAHRLELANPVRDDELLSVCDYVGEGYARVTPAGLDAMSMVARLEGVALDPVYTGKAMAGLIDYLARGRIAPADDIVFVHTGGTPALFAYNAELLDHLAQKERSACTASG